MSTSATARSRVALSTEIASVQASTTSPVVAAPCCHSMIAQHSKPSVKSDRHDGMKDAQLLQIEQAPPPRVHFAIDRRLEAAVLAKNAAERPHQRHIADDVDHLAVDGRGLVGEVVMQRPAGRGEAKHQAAP